MELLTRQFGKVQIDEAKIITMPGGIPGFSNAKRFIILDHDDIRPFHSFQCVDLEELSFIIMDPFLFKGDYAVDIDPYLKEMAWEDDSVDDLYLYVIINAADPDPRKMTANLMGPLLINVKKNQGVQMMVNDRQYSSKYLIFNEKNSDSQK
ncbi:flagellar assembly protein FliW [Desulfatiferula olefinivorans]